MISLYRRDTFEVRQDDVRAHYDFMDRFEISVPPLELASYQTMRSDVDQCRASAEGVASYLLKHDIELLHLLAERYVRKYENPSRMLKSSHLVIFVSTPTPTSPPRRKPWRWPRPRRTRSSPSSLRTWIRMRSACCRCALTKKNQSLQLRFRGLTFFVPLETTRSRHSRFIGDQHSKILLFIRYKPMIIKHTQNQN